MLKEKKRFREIRTVPRIWGIYHFAAWDLRHSPHMSITFHAEF
jgi:hypothetical protein